MKILGREPTLWIAVLNAAVILLGTLQFRILNGDQATLIVVAINAVFAALNAAAVRPVSPVAFTYAVGALVAVAASYGLALPPETVAALNVSVVAILGLLARGQVSPVPTPATNASLDPTPEAARVIDGYDPS